MVFVRVREVFDLHTVRDKMTLIGVHTPKASLIAKNFPGLLMQCKAYRCVSADVRIACASMLPADPLQVSTTDGDIAPEDMFNPILYKATTNIGLSQIEARIQALGESGNSATITGDSAITVNTGLGDSDFSIYYGLLADAHGWKHAMPQSGLEMRNLKPLVYEMLYAIGDNDANADSANIDDAGQSGYLNSSNLATPRAVPAFKGHAKAMPFINCTSASSLTYATGFNSNVGNHHAFVPCPKVYCGVIIVPPSRLHELYYRMVVEWTLEFSGIRSIGEIGSFSDLAVIGNATHHMDYDFSSSSKALGVSDTKVDTFDDAGSVSANVEVTKVM